MALLATIIVLGVLIFVHELGHFWAAKLVDIEVQRFSIGLGPRVWGFQRGETEYVLSAIPLGGYVKMGGMEDEVMERVEGGAKAEPRKPGPRDFDGKPVWARAFVLSAGVIMNWAFAFLAYGFVAAAYGVPQEATDRLGWVRSELVTPGAEALNRLPVGSHVVRVGDRRIEHWGDVREAFMEAPGRTVSVETRDPAAAVDVTVPVDEEDRTRLAFALESWVEPVVLAVEPGSPADRGGLEAGDRVLSVDGTPVANWWDFRREIRARPDQRTELRIQRDGSELVRVVTPRTSETTDPETGESRTFGQVGIVPPSETVYVPVRLAEAVRIGWVETAATTSLILGFLGDLVTGGISPRSLGSIVTIGEASGQAAAEGLAMFMRFMALFSVNLAILNLLPIPILDGGHLLFLGIEAIRGRALSVEQRIRWSQVGFVIIVGIMLWALSNDFLRLFGL